MGLDVYLYKYLAPVGVVESREKEAEDESERIWETARAGRNYEAMSEQEKDEARRLTKVVFDKMGLGEYGEDETNKEKIEIDSEIHPKHMFKIGYLRSSYNAGGINHILTDRIGTDLYGIFQPGDEYVVRVNWEAALRKAQETLSGFKRYISQHGTYEVLKTNGLMENADVKCNADALAAFLKEKGRDKDKGSAFRDGWYCNKVGDFMMGKQPRLHAMILGIDYGKPATYVIVSQDDKTFEWYVEALEVVVEMCRWVLKQGDSTSYILHWSS